MRIIIGLLVFICGPLLFATKGKKLKKKVTFQDQVIVQVSKAIKETEEAIEASCFHGFVDEGESRGFDSFDCKLCNKACFRAVLEFWMHLKDKHSDKPIYYPCPYKNCTAEKIVNFEDIRAHVFDDHLNLLYPCAYCTGTDFRTQYDYFTHLVRWHNISPWSCSICSFQFPTAEGLRLHEADPTSHTKQIYACTVCWKLFRTSDSLQAHHQAPVLKIATTDQSTLSEC